ncbi:MAG: hypothetical protein IJ500_00535 [Alphaproteobacteria bacterium]|nr:hypothetical protein [Alphaproteobacteria bacterium]MBQ8729508.1 hypothetical protein [Alphaproteobacteria bacterium]
MRKTILAILLLGLTGCMSGTPNGEYVDAPVECAGDCSGVNFSMPNGNDLKLETDRHVVHVTADPNTNYAYYVWTGDKSYDDDPDIMVENGEAYVLTVE